MNTDRTPSADSIHIRPATAADRLPLYRMLELYQHDLSDIWDQDLDTHGEYGYALDRFANQGDCQAFVALVGGHYAGFALVDHAVKIGIAGHWMDQFFILKKYRRRGLGRMLASHVFSAMPGAWEVGQMPENRAAQKFWRKTIADYTAGNYQEQKLTEGWWQGFVQSFSSATDGNLTH